MQLGGRLLTAATSPRPHGLLRRPCPPPTSSSGQSGAENPLRCRQNHFHKGSVESGSAPPGSSSTPDSGFSSPPTDDKVPVMTGFSQTTAVLALQRNLGGVSAKNNLSQRKRLTVFTASPAPVPPNLLYTASFETPAQQSLAACLGLVSSAILASPTVTAWYCHVMRLAPHGGVS